jgi:hypothetical protein
MKRVVVHLYVKISLQADFYMIRQEYDFVANVVDINPMQETMDSSVINRPTSAIVELNAITKFHKYRRFHEGHHFILMAMEVHSALGAQYGSFHHGVCPFYPR